MSSRTPPGRDFGSRPVFGPGPSATAPAGRPDGPLTLLFVCTANISRSPYAELRAAQMLAAAMGRAVGQPSTWAVASAGIPGHTDRPMDPQMRQQAIQRGVSAESCDAHRSRPLTPALVESAGLILTMEKRQRNDVLDTYPAAHRRVLTLAQAARAAQQVNGGARVPAAELVRRLVAAAPSATGRLDVTDPYLRGEEVAQRVAGVIDDYLVTLTSAMCRALAPLATVQGSACSQADTATA